MTALAPASSQLGTRAAVVAAAAVAGAAWLLASERARRRTRRVRGGLHEDVSVPGCADEVELWHNGLSLCCAKVRVCLDEKGVRYRRHAVDMLETGAAGTTTPAFLADVNPAGTVPVLAHRGHPVYDSHYIVAYVDLHLGGPAQLTPADSRELMVMDLWKHRAAVQVGGYDVDAAECLENHAGNCAVALALPLLAVMVGDAIPLAGLAGAVLLEQDSRHALTLLWLKLAGPRALTLPALRRRLRAARDAMGAHLDAVEVQLARGGGEPWLCGHDFTLADVCWMPLLERLRLSGWEAYFLETRPHCRAYWHRLQARPSFETAVRAPLPRSAVDAAKRLQQLKRECAWFREALEGV